MKKQTKQILALLLAICSVVTFMMPTVFATGTLEGASENVGEKEYQFYLPEFKDKKLASLTAQIKEGYEAGTYDWRYEAAASGYQFRLKDVHEGVTADGGNSFHNANTESVVYYGGGSQWFAVRIKSPGAGEYDLTLTHGATNKGGTSAKVYFVKASEIDNKLGTNAAAYAEAMSADPYQANGTSEVFTTYYDAVTSAMAGKTPVMTPNFYSASAAKDLTATGTFTFEADCEYVMIVQSNGYSYIESLKATLVAEEPPVETPEENREPKHYQIYLSEFKDRRLAEVLGQVKAGYDAGTYDWRYEAAASAYQFRLKDVHEGVTANGGNAFQNNATESLMYYGGGNQWFAIRIQSPGAGEYALTLTHGAGNRGGNNGKVFFVKASEIDNKLGANAATYAEAMSADPYQNNGADEAFTKYYETVTGAMSGKTPVMTPNFYAASATKDLTATGTFRFEANTEYVMIVQSNGQSFLESLDAIPTVEEEDPTESTEATETTESTESTETTESTEPSQPKDDNDPSQHYQIYLPEFKDRKLSDVLANVKAGYESGVYDWRYEAAASAYQFRVDGVDGASGNGGNMFHNTSTESLLYYGGGNQWFAIRIKSPGAGKFDLTLTYGAHSKGGSTGKVFFIKASEIDDALGANVAAYAESMSANPYQANGTSEAFTAYYAAVTAAMTGKTAVMKPNFYNAEGYTKGKTSVGRFTFEADTEYVMIVQSNGHSFLNALDAVPTPADAPELEETPDESLNITFTEGVYQFNIPEYSSSYLYHYKTEEEVGRPIMSSAIAKLYDEGKLNWCYTLSNGYSQFAGSYISATVGEGNYLVFKIKAPGTGTYELTYKHLAINNEKSATYGDVHVIPVVEGKDYLYIKGEAASREPIIKTNYYAEETGVVTVTGSYPAFEEGKEYWICLGVADDDASKSNSVRLYPDSISMVRTGEWAPEPGNEPDDGTVYQLFLEEYANQYLYHSTEDSVYDEVAQKYANGSLNWRFESVAGNAYYQTKFLQLGTNKLGNAAIFRIKAPGTGTYKITLKHYQNSDGKAVNEGSVYILPYEGYEGGLTHTEQINRLARAPIMTTSYQSEKPGTPRAEASGTYGFEAGKEYLVYIYGNDSADPNNTSPSSAYMYVDRLVMKRIGEYIPEENNITLGGVAVESPVSVFSTNDNYLLTEVNGHDYLGIPAYGGTLMIYDLDEWRLLDEAYTDIETPRGAAADHNGNYWLVGAALTMYCYNPYTMSGFSTPKFLVGGSAHAMACGDDGYLYFGCHATTGSTIFRVDPNNTTAEKASYTSWPTPTWGKYVGDIHQEGDYVYAAVSGDDRHELQIYNKYTGKLEASYDITEGMGTTRYLTGMDFLEPGILALCTPYALTVFNTETREFITAEEFGVSNPVYRGVSEVRDGKSYFVTMQDGLCEYDLETNRATILGGEFSTNKTRLRGKDKNFVTIDDSRLPNPCLVTYGGMSEDGLNLYCYNIEEKRVITLIGLVDRSYAYGQNLHSIANGLPGSGEIYFGAAYDAPVGVYNTNTQEFSRQFSTNGQSDSFLVYKDTMYIGEYNLCTLTQMKDGKAISLFRLNDEHKIFDQARIHTITAGDDKVFVGTVPHVYRNGGLIAWYDLESELTYVVTGPKPEDVYYTKASQVMPTYTWYSAVTHEEVDFSKEFDQDTNGDGVCEYFLGPIPLQSITKLVYRDGLLFGISAPRGGSGAIDPVDENAKIFVYDVENMKMLKVIDLRQYVSGLPEKLLYFATLAADPDIDNKYWFIFSETLMSFTYDRDTNQFKFKVELEFDRTTQWDGARTTRTRDIIFKDGYMYFCFDKIGGFVKVNKENPKDYVQLLSNFKNINEIPIVYVLGEDGDLYYLTGDTNMYVLNLDVTEEELLEAQAVQDAIDLISETVTLEDREAIEAARIAWDTMDPANQPYVNNYQKLVNAEVELLKYRVDALGENITLDQEQELKDIGNDYRALTLSQRMQINYLKVSKAESQMSLLVADRLVKRIAALGEITLEKVDEVRDARAEFMALSRYERTLITNIEILNAAESTIMRLTLQRNEADAVIKKINDIGFVFFNFSAVSEARRAYDKLDDATKALVDNYGTLVAAEVLIVAECVITVAIIGGGAVVCVVPKFRKKIFNKKAKAE